MAQPEPHSVIALLQAMVRIDSVNGAISQRHDAETALADWLEGMASTWGLSTRRLPIQLAADDDGERDAGLPDPAAFPSTPQLLVWHEVDRALPWLLFESHMDTVSTQGMSIDPQGGELRDGCVWGRGSCDTKGTGAAMLWALKAYAASAPGNAKPFNVALVFTVDEEITMVGARSFARHDFPVLRQELGLDPVGVVVGEPTLLQPVIAHNGVQRWEVEIEGVAAHSSVPQMGRSAILDMMKIADAIQRDYLDAIEATHPLTGKAVGCITLFNGGTQVNIVPDRCGIHIDRRLTPDEDPVEETGRLRAIAEGVQLGAGAKAVVVTPIRYAPALRESASAAFLPTVQRALKNMGLPGKPIGAPFATDAGDLFKTAGLPAIVLGPGDPRPAHTHNESVAVAEIERGVEAYLAIMRSG